MPELTGQRLGRVYAVCTEVPPEVVGGLGRYAERMVAVLREAGTPVEVFGATSHRATAGTDRAGDVTLHRVRAAGAGNRLARIAGLLWFNLRVAARILRADAGRSGSVVAVHDWMGAPAGLLCRVLGRRPVVFHVHTRELAAAPGRRRSPVSAGITALENTLARVAQAVVVPSTGLRDDLAARGWPAGRLRVVPHGCEDADLVQLAGRTAAERDRIRASVRRRYLTGEGGALVVFAGRLSPHKGVGTLLRAAALLVGERPRLRVVLVGDQAPRTRDRATVARLVQELGLTGQVLAGPGFLPPAEVYAHFLAADVCAFPSTYEPFGLVAVEAMALARPVVVGPGYSPEVVGDGALRCRRDSPAELAAALRQCLDDPVGAARRARRGAAYVRDRFRWTRTAELTLATYAEVAR